MGGSLDCAAVIVHFEKVIILRDSLSDQQPASPKNKKKRQNFELDDLHQEGWERC